MKKICLFSLLVLLLLMMSCSNSVVQPTAGVRDEKVTVENLTTSTLTLNGLEITPSDTLSIDVAYCSLKCVNCDLNEILIAPCHFEVSGECGNHSFHQVSSDA